MTNHTPDRKLVVLHIESVENWILFPKFSTSILCCHFFRGMCMGLADCDTTRCVTLQWGHTVIRDDRPFRTMVGISIPWSHFRMGCFLSFWMASLIFLLSLLSFFFVVSTSSFQQIQCKEWHIFFLLWNLNPPSILKSLLLYIYLPEDAGLKTAHRMSSQKMD